MVLKWVSTISGTMDAYTGPGGNSARRPNESTTILTTGTPSVLGQVLCCIISTGCMNSIYVMICRHSIPIRSSHSRKVGTRFFLSLCLSRTQIMEVHPNGAEVM